MLSIGKLNPGRASYYAAQLSGGADEYYTRGETERPAVWLGSAARRLGLSGRVEPDPFRRLLDAAHPQTGDPLGVPRTTDRRLAGFDLCFSAPKSVSVAWALSPPVVADAIAAAHDRAVAQAVEVFETEVARARRGKRAAQLVETEGVVAAAFGHLSSRAGDPQLHTHVVIPNLAVDGGGRWSALAGDRVYRWAKTLGYLYQGALRAELTDTLGVTWGPVRNGTAEIAGIDPGLCEAFSTRRAQITAAMEQSGATTRAAAEIAALATRPAKNINVSLDELRTRWRERAHDLGHEIEPVGAAPQTRVAADRTTELTGQLLSAEGLTAHSSSFDRRDILQALVAGHPDGIRPAGAVNAADRLLDRDEVVPLAASRPAGPRYTTAELLRVETDLIARAARPHRPVGIVAPEQLAPVLAERPTLTAEQKAMVTSLTTSGAGVEIVVGRGGAGKTYALDASRAAWQAAGHQVIGAALAARAAAELESGSGIPSTTVDRLLADLDRPGPLSPLGRGTIVVVDEAAMVGTRKLARLVGHAERADAKLVLVGDHRQLPEIEAGGAFAALAQTVPVSELAGNRRQVEDWERDALAELRSGSVPDAVAAYHRAGRVTMASTPDAAREQMVDDWWQSRQAGEVGCMYALRRADVEDLNRRARARFQANGHLGQEQLHAAGRDFAAGDQVMCLRNDRRLGVRNGTRSTVRSVDVVEGTVILADGTRLPADYLEAGYLGHAYASTVHKSQGATVDRAFLLGSDALYREAGYVGLSRARQSTQLYIVAPEPEKGPEVELDPLTETIRRLSRSQAQTLAADQLHHQPDRQPFTPTERLTERAALLADPPAWAVEALGSPPVTGAERDMWSRHAARIAAYRDIYQITDPADPLGPRPEDPVRLRAWDLAHLSLHEHQRSLELDQGLCR